MFVRAQNSGGNVELEATSQSYSSGSKITLEVSGKEVVCAIVTENGNNNTFVAEMYGNKVTRSSNGGAPSTYNLPYTVGSFTYEKTAHGYAFTETATGRTIYATMLYR